MESQLQELIEKIKTEGIMLADREAEHIRTQAQAEGAEIIRNAKNEAEHIINNAKNDAHKIQDAGEKALGQAGRNLLLGLRAKIIALFDSLVQADVGEALTISNIESMLERIAQNWQYQKYQGLEVLLNKKDLEILKREYLQKIQKKFREGVILKPADTVESGFFIGEKNKNIYYDFTDMGIAEMLSQYLNPHLSKVLKDQAPG